MVKELSHLFNGKRDASPFPRRTRHPGFLLSARLARSLFRFLFRLTLTSHFSEALITVYGASTPGLEGYFSLCATRGAGHFRPLARPFGSSEASLSPRGTAIRTTTRLVLKPARFIEFLLSSAEYELGSAVTAGQGLVSKRHR